MFGQKFEKVVMITSRHEKTDLCQMNWFESKFRRNNMIKILDSWANTVVIFFKLNDRELFSYFSIRNFYFFIIIQKSSLKVIFDQENTTYKNQLSYVNFS